MKKIVASLFAHCKWFQVFFVDDINTYAVNGKRCAVHPYYIFVYVCMFLCVEASVWTK